MTFSFSCSSWGIPTSSSMKLMKSYLLLFSFLAGPWNFEVSSKCLSILVQLYGGKTQRACLLKMQKPWLIYWHQRGPKGPEASVEDSPGEWWVHTETGWVASVVARRWGVVRFLTSFQELMITFPCSYLLLTFIVFHISICMHTEFLLNYES